MRRHLGTALAVIAALAVGAPTSATTLYSDTFSRVTGSGDANGDPNGPDPNFSDWGMNDNGLGGTVTQTWVAGPSRGGGGRNAVTDGELGLSFGTSSTFEFDAAAASPNGFQIALDFARYITVPDPGPGPNGYIAFGLGVDTGTAPTDFTAIGAGDFAVLFQQANAGNAANAEVYADNTLVTNFDYLNPDVAHTLVLTATPAVPGAYGETDTVNINVLVDGTVSQDFSVNGGADFGNFTVSANNFEARFIDNLVVSAIPEPGSALLLGVALAGTVIRRRR